MITLGDSLKLAYTKIRTRRIRLFIVLFVSSLLFAGLIAGSLIVTGGIDSFRRFSDEGFANRYILAGTYQDSDMFTNSSPTEDPARVARIESLEKKQREEKVAEAKRLGIEYSKDSEQSAVTRQDGQVIVDYNSPIAYKVAGEDSEKINTLENFKKQLPSAKEYYRSLRLPQSVPTPPSLSLVENGKEKLSNSTSYDYGMTRGLAGMTTGWTLMDEALLKPFILPGQNLDRGSDGSIPIIASYSAAQEVLKLPKLGAKATDQDKKQRLEDVRSKIAGTTFQVCYRNNTSATNLRMTIEQQAEIKKNKNKRDFEMPNLVYKEGKLCQQPVVERDTRNAIEKQNVEKQMAFDKKFGKADPTSQLITFRIVGTTQDPSMDFGGGGGITDVFNMLLASSVGVSWVSPIAVYDELPVAQDIFKQERGMIYDPQERFYAEFSSASTMRDAYKNRNCVVVYPGMPIEDGAVKCSKNGRAFSLMPFGSISLALDDFQQGFRKVQLVVAAVIAGIASVILMGMIGRIVADARKETAVFRAVGASRLAIAQIYIVYTIYLALLTLLVACIIGFGIALFVNSSFAAQMGLSMALMFNVSDLSMPFRLYGVSLYDLGLIAAVVVGASLVGSIIPIAHNVRRDPIKDMREE